MTEAASEWLTLFQQMGAHLTQQRLAQSTEADDAADESGGCDAADDDGGAASELGDGPPASGWQQAQFVGLRFYVPLHAVPYHTPARAMLESIQRAAETRGALGWVQMRAGAAGSNDALVGEWRGHPRWELELRRILTVVQRASRCDAEGDDSCGAELPPPRVHVYPSTKIWLAYASYRLLSPSAAIPKEVARMYTTRIDSK